jgi:hypothetical protein
MRGSIPSCIAWIDFTKIESLDKTSWSLFFYWFTDDWGSALFVRCCKLVAAFYSWAKPHYSVGTEATKIGPQGLICYSHLARFFRVYGFFNLGKIVWSPLKSQILATFHLFTMLQGTLGTEAIGRQRLGVRCVGEQARILTRRKPHLKWCYNVLVCIFYVYMDACTKIDTISNLCVYLFGQQLTKYPS